MLITLCSRVKFLRRLPIYATGVGFATLLLVVADARNWSDLTLLLVGLTIAVFYTVTILVPWLIYEQFNYEPPRDGHVTLLYYDVNIRDPITGTTITPNGGNGATHAPVTHGRGVPTHKPTSVLTP
jgi:hypothetical protein